MLLWSECQTLVTNVPHSSGLTSNRWHAWALKTHTDSMTFLTAGLILAHESEKHLVSLKPYFNSGRKLFSSSAWKVPQFILVTQCLSTVSAPSHIDWEFHILVFWKCALSVYRFWVWFFLIQQLCVCARLMRACIWLDEFNYSYKTWLNLALHSIKCIPLQLDYCISEDQGQIDDWLGAEGKGKGWEVLQG